MKSAWFSLGLTLAIGGVIFYFGLAPDKPYDTAEAYSKHPKPTDEQEKWDDYGEAPIKGKTKVKEPFCFWSALTFSVSGILAMGILDLRIVKPSGNPISIASWYSIPLGLIMVWMGPGSMIEHGALLKSLGWFDSASIHWFLIFVIYYALVRLFVSEENSSSARGVLIFWVVYLGTCVFIGLPTYKYPDLREWMTIILIPTMGLLLLVPEVVACIIRTCAKLKNPNAPPTVEKSKIPKRDAWWLLGAGVFGALAFVALFGAHKGNFLAHSAEMQNQHGFQFHGVWHTLMAFTTFCIFAYLRSENPEGAPESP